MSTTNLIPSMPLDSYIGSQSGYVQLLSMDMLNELSWPCQFLSESISPQCMEMPDYPLSPMSPGSMTVPSADQGNASQRRRQGPPLLSARPSITSTQSSGSPISPKAGFAGMLQPPRQDRERRKAQNRASQRAYRERKEVQLRDLATNLKETEIAMAEAKHENEQLEARLEKMRNEVEVLRKENEALRRTDVLREGSRMHLKVTSTQDKCVDTTGRREGESSPPHCDEGYGGGSTSNTASEIGTPKFVEMGGFDWDRVLLESKGMAAMTKADGQIF